MIPINLTITGFLSYRGRVEVDFTRFDLACISGHNGAGKSSLLDAVTWALFGVARKRDESLINAASNAAEVNLTFAYENNLYRVQRALLRGKTGLLEFHIRQSEDGEPPKWKPLTERTMRETQARLEQTLRLDYDTFVNASFFLQGKADQFTQQRPADRKRILASILGLEAWEVYRLRSAERRKGVEGEVAALDGRLSEINSELEQEASRKKQLAGIQRELAGIQQARQAQEKNVETASQMTSVLDEQRKLVETLRRQSEAAGRRLYDLRGRAASRQSEYDAYAQIMARAAEIQHKHTAWQQARAELERWEGVAEQYRQQEKRRQPFLEAIHAAGGRLQQERQTLLAQAEAIRQGESAAATLQRQIEQAQGQLAEAEQALAERAALQQTLSETRRQLAGLRAEVEAWDALAAQFHEHEKRRQPCLDAIHAEEGGLIQERQALNRQEQQVETLRQEAQALSDRLLAAQEALRQSESQLARRAELEEHLAATRTAQAEAKAENPRLKSEMDELKARIDQLMAAEGAYCPTCGQELREADRQKLIQDLNEQGKGMGDRYRANQALLRNFTQTVSGLEKEISDLARFEQERIAQTGKIAEINTRLESAAQAVQAWESQGLPRRAQIEAALAQGTFAGEARARLAQIDEELKAIGYDAAGRDETLRRSSAVQKQIDLLEGQILALASADAKRLACAQAIASLTTRLEQIRQSAAAWQEQDAPRLAELSAVLEQENYALEARASLALVEAALAAIGYDPAAHEDIRRREQNGRQVEAELRELERAQATLATLENELGNLKGQCADLQRDFDAQQAEHTKAAASLAAAQASTPNLYAAERELMSLKEQENRLRMEMGAASQKVMVLDDLKTRRRLLEVQREDMALQISRYKQLERAFGKDGVPALLIEQALPQIETRANQLLEQLSAGDMTVHFVTQAAYKDKKRDDLKETLDIQISDRAGTRDYEMFSGGEAFRINFAVRLALSEVLAQRAGARLQTLVIDEGFGSQDAEGRQRLIEAINLIKPDFAKILVITHIDELKEAFPSRIEVEKGENGSSVRVIS